MTFSAVVLGWTFAEGWSLPLCLGAAVLAGLVFGAVNGA